MKTSRWLFAFALVILVSLSGSLAFAQDAVVKYYKQGLEDLQNNLVAEAIKAFEAGLSEGQGGSNPLPDTDENIQQTRYAYAYALAQDGRLFDAIPELDVLVESAPDMDVAKYLLGVTLMRTMSNENIIRGLSVLKQMADGSSDPNARTIAMNGAAQLGYNVSTGEHASGDPEAAAKLINAVLADYGQEPGRDAAENNHIHFALGVYLKDSGDIAGAMSELDTVAGTAADYALQNGTSLTQVRGDAYYQAALAQLQQGGQAGGQGALDLLRKLEEFEGAGGSNAHHIMHAKALAYNLTGNANAVNATLKSLRSANPGYYSSVTK
jgi:tetratricopeptide (TPR) repeat protein